MPESQMSGRGVSTGGNADAPLPVADTIADPIISQLPADWRIDRDVPCPVCRYNLRGRREARCPECGATFRWQALLHVSCVRCGESLAMHQGDDCPRCDLPLHWPALLESAAVIRRSLFEYSNRPLRALLRTVLAVLLPWRFWRGFALEMPPNLGRLRTYRRVMRATALLGLALVPLLDLLCFWQQFPIRQASYYERWLIVIGMALLVPFLVSRALPRFTPTLARFRVRGDQLTRCTSYLTTVGFGLGVVAVVLFFVAACQFVRTLQITPAWTGWRWAAWDYFFHPLQDVPTVLPEQTWWRRSGRTSGRVLDLGLAGFLLWSLIFLYVALRRYLQLSSLNAIALTLSSYLIALLLSATLYALIALSWLVFSRSG